MAKSAQDRQGERMEVALFIARLYEVGEYSTWTEFANEVGVAPSTMSDWKRAGTEGGNAPSGYYLLKMIRAVTLRRPEGIPRAVLDSWPHSVLREQLAEARERAARIQALLDPAEPPQDQRGSRLELP